MKHKDFTYKELLAFGWEKTKRYFWFLIGLTIAYFAIAILTSDIAIVSDIVSMCTMIALIAISLVIADGHTPQYKDLLKPFRSYKTVLHYFLAMILYILIVLVGLVLLILPGIYLAVRLQFSPYLIVDDENMGPIESLKKSMKLTQGIFWKLFGFSVVTLLFNIAGALCFGIGLLITLPITGIAYTKLYRKLSETDKYHHDMHHHDAPVHHEGVHLAAH